MFSTLIYEEISQRSERAALEFSKDYRRYFEKRRLTQTKGTFPSVRSYFFTLFSSESVRYSRELSCVSGNNSAQLWMEDFRNVILPTYIRDYSTLSLTNRAVSSSSMSELGTLLGAF